MSLEALRRALVAEGEARATETRQQAEQERDRIRAEANEARTNAIAHATREAELGLRRALGQRVAEAREQAQRRILAKRQLLLDRVFEEARAALTSALEESEAQAASIARAESALRHMPEGPVKLRCSGVELARILEAALGRRDDLRIVVEPGIGPGFSLEGAGGSLEVDATLPLLLEIHRPTLAIEVLQRLRTEAGS